RSLLLRGRRQAAKNAERKVRGGPAFVPMVVAGDAPAALRLEMGRFTWPTIQDGVITLTASQLSVLLDGLDWRKVAPRAVDRPAIPASRRTRPAGRRASIPGGSSKTICLGRRTQ